jgi:UDP-N-acetyl-D-glucosamine dehydrogenase
MQPSAPSAALAEKIESRTAVVGIIGMGYVGLPLSLAVEQGGFRVLGFDTDPVKVESLSRGHSYIRHISSGALTHAVDRKQLQATSDFSRLVEADVIAICVPTPLTPEREPDMRFVTASRATRTRVSG